MTAYWLVAGTSLRGASSPTSELGRLKSQRPDRNWQRRIFLECKPEQFLATFLFQEFEAQPRIEIRYQAILRRRGILSQHPRATEIPRTIYNQVQAEFLYPPRQHATAHDPGINEEIQASFPEDQYCDD